MPIEFNCPHCNAIIRVPDNAAGGKGKCPRCTTRIKVPKKSMPRVIMPPTVVQPADEEPDVEIFPGAEEHKAPPIGRADDEPVLLEDAEEASEPMFVPKTPALGELPSEPEPIYRPAVRTSYSKYRKRKDNNLSSVVLIVALLVFVGAVGGLSWYFWQQHSGSQLAGTLVAKTAAGLDLKPAELSASSLGMSLDEIRPVLQSLEKSPVKLPSSLMVVEIGGGKRNVTVTVKSGTKTSFYRVEVQDNEAITKFRAEKGPELEEIRARDISNAGAKFLVDYTQVTGKKAAQNALNDYRNTLALPALVRGLGYQVVAAHGQSTYRCCYEDSEGALYFLMPPDIKSFELVGFKSADGKTRFPGRYLVNVSGTLEEIPDPAPKPTEKEEKTKEKDPSKEEAPGLSEMTDDMPKKGKKMGKDDESMDEMPAKKRIKPRP